MQVLFSKYWFLIAAIWYTGNGILHDIFVTINHKGKYDRELLRLLMDGHVLILSGLIMFVCYFMSLKAIQYGPVVAVVTATAMLVYCMMIFPFLKSFGTMAVSAIVIAVALKMLIARG